MRQVITSWWRHNMEIFYRVTGTMYGNSVTGSFNDFFDLRLNKLVIWESITLIMTSLQCIPMMTQFIDEYALH